MIEQQEPEKLYAAREPIFAKMTKGPFRTLKTSVMSIALIFYFITPWLRWDRGEGMPDQAVLIDLAHRRFFFFFIEIWPEEFYFIAGLLIMAGIGLFVFTSALGRVWCGYACPQTVWSDLFRFVEHYVEGDRNARMRLHNENWTWRKIRLRVTKISIWLLIALATGVAWDLYFADAPTLLRDILTLKAPLVAYNTILILSATTFIFGGIIPEQVCIYMCPWPRIQAAMMDEDTLTVAYRDWRGEPRGKHRKSDGADLLGDCIDCNACVAVCPMGIDIRDGQQLACITCALCIDACDDVMEKTGRERGLIDYIALSDESLERAGNPRRSILKHIFRPRVLVYYTLWGLVGLGLFMALLMRGDMRLNVHPVRNPFYTVLSDGTIRNTYEVTAKNMSAQAHEFEILITNPNIEVQIQGYEGTTFIIPPDQALNIRLYLDALPQSEEAQAPRTDFEMILRSGESKTSKETLFHGRVK